MNKLEARSFLKELLAECKLDSDSFILMEPNPNDVLSSGYKIRIITILDGECRQRLREITRKFDLGVIEEQNQIIVYKPEPNHAGNLILK
jgi:hypothetical protein